MSPVPTPAELFLLLRTKIPTSWPDTATAQITTAYEYAQQAHEGQMRASGEPFVAHPIRVATLIAERDLDTPSVIAALLHDVVEDTDRELDDIRQHFGEVVASLVDGLTKIHALPRTTPERAVNAENYRKLLLATAEDWRVVLIKLADRVDNIRTIDALSPERQQRIARETMMIYAPLAHRLGIESWRSELQERCFAVLHPQEYEHTVQQLQQISHDKQELLDQTVQQMQEILQQHHIVGDVSSRQKNLYSIWQKTKTGKAIHEVYDVWAIRVITETDADCYALLGLIHGRWAPVPDRIKDYVAMPKPNMYQSLHTTVLVADEKKTTPLEVQIRTQAMHELAEWGLASHVQYKEGQVHPKATAWLRGLRDWQQQLESNDFLDDLLIDLGEQELFIFTPNGDVINLPQGATPLDVAYTIHTDVGHHCVGARVNGRMVPLTARLYNGDRVEILQGTRSGPNRDWEKIVVTRRARQRIRAYFREIERQDPEQHGRQMLASALRKAGLPDEILRSPEVVAVGSEMLGKTVDAHAFYSAISDGTLLPKSIVGLLQQQRAEDEPAIPAMAQAKPLTALPSSVHAGATLPSPVTLMDDDTTIPVQMAACCHPLPPDDIVGRVSQQHGIRVHRTDCNNVLDGERLVPVAWRDEQVAVSAAVSIIGSDRQHLLEDICRVFALNNASILQAQCFTQHDQVYNQFVLQVKNSQQLQKILAQIRAIQGVFDAGTI